MSTYLPKDSGPGSAYSEGGGLYALGELGLWCLILIHSTYRIHEFNNDLLYYVELYIDDVLLYLE